MNEPMVMGSAELREHLHQKRIEETEPIPRLQTFRTNAVDLLGQSVRGYTVVARAESTSRQARWILQCDCCGEEITRVGHQIRLKQVAPCRRCYPTKKDRLERVIAASRNLLGEWDALDCFQLDEAFDELRSAMERYDEM